MFSQCVFSFGRTTPLFSVNEGGGTIEDFTKSFLITVDLGPNAKSGANLMINVTAEANDIVTRGTDSVSSDFQDTFRSQTSNIVLNALGTVGLFGINNGSGSPESGVRAVDVSGLNGRFRDEKVTPGTREAIAAVVYVCEGGTPVTPNVVILPAVAAAAPTIAGYPGALACVTSSNPDTFATRLLRVRVGVSGNSGAVGTLRLWDDANDNGVLFESGEFVLSSSPINGVAVFGSLNNPLLSGTRPNADPAQGMWAAQTRPITVCDSTADNPQPLGASKGCPHVLVITFDVNSSAQTGEVVFDVVLDVGNLPIESGTGDQATASSNQISTAPARTRILVTGGGAGPSKSLAKRIAEHSGNPNTIEDEDILWAMGKWAKNEPLDNAQITDSDILNGIRVWADGSTVASSVNKLFTRAGKPAAVSAKTNATTIAPGQSFFVTTTVDGKSLNGLMLNQNLPAGWTISPVMNAGAAFNGSSWLWLNLNGKATVTYKVTVPANAQNGVYTISSLTKAAVPAYESEAGKISIAVSGAPVALKVNTISLANGSFVVEGTGIASTEVKVFSLNGARVFSGSAEGNQVAFSNINSVANGVYFYVVTVKGADGKIASSNFKKLVVLH
ncbi:T9SS type A sorting domain-containing protein [Candidatus Acetothermia bacterium]|nr:T9SS type A sorting domain-containing protein [Candidatus Acetothermia bacterium]